MQEILADLVNLSKKRGYKKYIILALQDPKNRKALRKCIDNYKHYGGVNETEYEKYLTLKAEADRLRKLVEDAQYNVDRARRDLKNQEVTTDGLRNKINTSTPLSERRGLNFPAIAVQSEYPYIFAKQSKLPEGYNHKALDLIYNTVQKEYDEVLNNLRIWEKQNYTPETTFERFFKKNPLRDKSLALLEFWKAREEREADRQSQIQNRRQRPLS